MLRTVQLLLTARSIVQCANGHAAVWFVEGAVCRE